MKVEESLFGKTVFNNKLSRKNSKKLSVYFSCGNSILKIKLILFNAIDIIYFNLKFGLRFFPFFKRFFLIIKVLKQCPLKNGTHTKIALLKTYSILKKFLFKNHLNSNLEVSSKLKLFVLFV